MVNNDYNNNNALQQFVCLLRICYFKTMSSHLDQKFKPWSYCKLYLGSYFRLEEKYFWHVLVKVKCIPFDYYFIFCSFYFFLTKMWQYNEIALTPLEKHYSLENLIGVNKQATHTKDVHKQKYYYSYFFSIIFSTTTTKWTTKFEKCGHQFLCWWSLASILCLKQFVYYS